MYKFGTCLPTLDSKTTILYVHRTKSVTEIYIHEADDYERSLQTHGMYTYNIYKYEIFH